MERYADLVARQVVEAVDRRRFLLITDKRGRSAYLSKRFARPLYDRTMRKISRSFHARVGAPR